MGGRPAEPTEGRTAFAALVSDRWLKGEATRAETALLLTETLHHLITTVGPKLKSLPDNGDATGKAQG